MKKKVGVNVYAKINFTLNVGKKTGNLHEIDSLVSSINVYDTIFVSDRLDDKINLAFDSDVFVAPQENTVIKAIKALRDDFGDFGVDVTVKKNIPFCAGMGGSSADAAGVIAALSELFDFEKRYINYAKVCKKTGSDVLYMLSGGYARISGTGEKVEKLSYDGTFTGVAVTSTGVETKDVYKKFDELGGDLPTDNSSGFSQNMRLGNMLMKAACEINPQICACAAELEREGLTPNMTGSGSTVYAFTQDAREIAKKLTAKGLRTFAFETLPYGIEFL